MNEPISWDPSLVKKFSSSNHYKLLNQLKNEVKQYPLNNRKIKSARQNNEVNKDIINKSTKSNSQNISLSDNTNHSNDINTNNSTVSFNNAKNFSIYNNNNISRQNESIIPVQTKSNVDSSTPSFKDRLNKIDMK